jgi:CNT family concentrative nucleoside transporter
MESNRGEKVVAAPQQEQRGEPISQSPASGSIGANEKISPAPSFDEAMRKDGEVKYNSMDEKELGLKGTNNSDVAAEYEEEKPIPMWKKMLKKYMWVVNLFLWMVMTAWLITGLVLHRELGWLIPTLLYIAITIRLITAYVSTRFITAPIKWVWMNAVYKPAMMIPEKLRTPLSAAGAIGVIMIGSFATEESADNTRANRAISLLGLLIFIGVFWATSKNRKAIVWQTVIVGMLAQFIIAIFVLRTQAGFDIFDFIAYLATTLLGMASAGTIFLTNADVYDLGYFIVNVLPPIIFFVAFVQLLYYFGWLQWFVKKFATIFFYSMKVSGAEAVVAAASPFVGQGESAMLIKPFIPHLTDAEIHQVMTSGFATIAGSVLAAYIFMGISGVALISSCVMSIPASLAISKLRYPETEETLTSGELIVPEDDEERPSNFLHAFANGSWLGIKVAGMILAALLCILSLLELVNSLLTWWGHYFSISDPDLTLQLILGYLFYPVAFLLGVSRQSNDILLVAQLIGVKVIANEFVAFDMLTTDPAYEFLSDRSKIIATYAVCGFGNISSVGIQIGVLSTLAPGKSGRVAKVAISALISGVMATLTSASIAGMLISDNAQLFTGFTPRVAS